MKNLWFTSLALVFLFVGISIQYNEQKDDWWLTNKAQAKAESKACSLGLKDTVLQLVSSNYHLWMPSNFDGSKPTLVLVHGMGLNGIGQWKNQLEPFYKDYQLIVPDLVGYAGSSNPTMAFSPEIQAQTLHLALKELHVTGKVNLVGFSYGGLVVATFNDLYPQQTHKIAICDSPVKYFTKHIADSIVSSRGLNHFEQLLSPRTKKETKEFFDAVYGKMAPPLPGPIRKKASQFIFTTNADTKRKQMDHLEQFASNYVGKNYLLNTSNVLFFWGEKDGVIPLEVGLKLHRDYPLAVWKTHPKAKHDALMTFSDDYNTILKEHFEVKNNK